MKVSDQKTEEHSDKRPWTSWKPNPEDPSEKPWLYWRGSKNTATDKGQPCDDDDGGDDDDDDEKAEMVGTFSRFLFMGIKAVPQ